MPETYWLSVSEEAQHIEWPHTHERHPLRLRLTNAVTLRSSGTSGLFRTSPVFSLFDSDAVLLSKTEGPIYFCFLFYEHAFRVLGKLRKTNDAAIRARVLFTAGLASIIWITDTPDLDRLISIVDEKPRAVEIWKIEGGLIVSTTCQGPLPNATAPDVELPVYDLLPTAPRTAVDEFLAGMRLIVPNIVTHLPSHLPMFIQVTESVSELVSEMVFANDPSGLPPPTLSEYQPEEFSKDPALAESILHQNTDRIVQINSALAYLLTQALSGAVPILERRSIIRRHSLLGVGTAILALTNITRTAEKAFATAALETVLAERAGTAAPLPGLGDLPSYDASNWRLHNLDKFTVPPRKPFAKIPYFSGRLGFRETEYTVAASLHSITAGANPAWSLLTVTHELVHGHVRNLIAQILQGDPSRHPTPKWHEFYHRFAQSITRGPLLDENLLDSLRKVIFGYACGSLSWGSLTRDAHIDKTGGQNLDFRVKYRLPDEESLWFLLDGELRNISEVFVHVLDLQYFYRGYLSAYIPLIWRSWAVLPHVRGDLRQYVLRTLLVSATKTAGSSLDRFKASQGRVLEVLSPLADKSFHGVPTIKKAVELLQSPSFLDQHFLQFAGSLILVDLAENVLASARVRGLVHAGDPNLRARNHDDSFEEWLEYSLPDGFVDSTIEAPTAYLADRLARVVMEAAPHSYEAQTTAVLLACCSSSGHGQEVD